MEKRIKTGLLGGTFNPIHKGHLLLAQNAYKYCALDEVWFIPSGVSYMKKGQYIPSGKIRMEMVQAAIEDYPYFNSCSIEIEREGNSYTCETLAQLNTMYPDRDFYFIIGDDTLFTMETWYHYEVIFKQCTIIAALRDYGNISELEQKAKQLKEDYEANVIIMPTKAYEVSSSGIKKSISEGIMPTDKLPEKVIEYIEKNHIYDGK